MENYISVLKNTKLFSGAGENENKYHAKLPWCKIE